LRWTQNSRWRSALGRTPDAPSRAGSARRWRDRLGRVASAGRSWVDLLHAALVATPFEPGVEPRVQDVEPFLLAHEPGRQDEDIGIVVLARQLADLRAPHHRGTHVRIAVRDIAHSEARPASQDSALDDAGAHRLRDLPRIC